MKHAFRKNGGDELKRFDPKEAVAEEAPKEAAGDEAGDGEDGG